MHKPVVYLTFDLEEFDICNEFGQSLDWQQQVSVTAEGMNNLMPVLNRLDIPVTFFTTAAFANEQPDLIKTLAARHEIASHTFSHTSFQPTDLLQSRLALEAITGLPVRGIRMPRMKQVPMQWIKDSGYSYDSSINPTRLPGRYNFSHLPRTGFIQDGLLRIPASVSPRLRFPLFWLAFKNMPAPAYQLLARQTLLHTGYLNLYFHPWEFADLRPYKLPTYIKSPSGKQLLSRLEKLLEHLQGRAFFDQLQHYNIKKAHNDVGLPA